MSDSLWSHGLCSQWNSLGQNTGVGGCLLLQGISLTQGLNSSLPHCRQILFLIYKSIYFNWRLITLQYCIGFAKPLGKPKWLHGVSYSEDNIGYPSRSEYCSSKKAWSNLINAFIFSSVLEMITWQNNACRNKKKKNKLFVPIVHEILC